MRLSDATAALVAFAVYLRSSKFMPVRIGINIDGGVHFEELIEKVRSARARGFVSAWLPQSPGRGPREGSSRRRRHQLFGYDSITALAVAGQEVGGMELGTCVVPTFPRHPMVLAEQALTAHTATSGRFTLGIGVSHRHVVEDQWGYSYDRTAHRMREYATVLNQVFTTGRASFEGETVRANGGLSLPLAGRVPLLMAALGPRMLRVAGGHADGVITWMTGQRTLREHVVPALAAAAREAGRPAPRVVASLPVCLTEDPETAHRLAERMFLIYRSLPAYRAMLDREGAEHGGDIALIGSKKEITEGVRRLEDAGVTDLNALVIGSEDEQLRTRSLLPDFTDRPLPPAPEESAP